MVEDSGHVLLGEGVVGIAHEQARLAHRPVADHHALEHQRAGPVSHAAVGRPRGMVPPEPPPRPRAQPQPAWGVRRRRRSAQQGRPPGPMQRFPSPEGKVRRARGAAAAAASIAARLPALARLAALARWPRRSAPEPAPRPGLPRRIRRIIRLSGPRGVGNFGEGGGGEGPGGSARPAPPRPPPAWAGRKAVPAAPECCASRAPALAPAPAVGALPLTLA